VLGYSPAGATEDPRYRRRVSGQMVPRNSAAGRKCRNSMRPPPAPPPDGDRACGTRSRTLARPPIVAVDVADGRRMLLECLARLGGQAAEHGGGHGPPPAVELRRR